MEVDQQNSHQAIALVQTVRRNFEGLTKQEVKKAIQARKTQARLGHLSEATYRREVSRNSSHSLF